MFQCFFNSSSHLLHHGIVGHTSRQPTRQVGKATGQSTGWTWVRHAQAMRQCFVLPQVPKASIATACHWRSRPQTKPSTLATDLLATPSRKIASLYMSIHLHPSTMSLYVYTLYWKNLPGSGTELVEPLASASDLANGRNCND